MSPLHRLGRDSNLLFSVATIGSDRNALGLGKIRHKLLVFTERSTTLVGTAVHARTAALRTDLGVLGSDAAIDGLITGLAAEGRVAGGDGGADAVLPVAEESLGTEQRAALLGIGTAVLDLGM